jgi:thiol-disulfide isomerase/thioredoxin
MSCFLWVCLVLSLSLYGVVGLESIEAEDGSVCFNQCSGHGKCIDYSCHCYVGFHGDDCSVSFTDSESFVPILNAGHFNLTRANFTQTVNKNKYLVVGFSTYNCHKCIAAEVEYSKLSQKLRELKVPFGRVNIDEMKDVSNNLGIIDIPALVIYVNKKPVIYRGVQTYESMLQYIYKRLQPPVKKLKTLSEVTNFLDSRTQPQFSLSTVMIVGFFSDPDIEEDEIDEFTEMAKEFQVNEDYYFAMTTSSTVVNHFKRNKTIDRTPSIILIGDDNQTHSINMNELYDVDGGMKEWIMRKSIPLVGKITPQNFPLYERLNIPMLLLFLDLEHEFASTAPGRLLGGRSGGVLNELLVEEFRIVAKEHQQRIVCGYLDGNLYEDHMKLLGLMGGKERLPSLAFNTRDGKKIPFPEDLPVNADTLNQFIADFLTGKLNTKKGLLELSQRALQRSTSTSRKNTVQRKEIKAPPKVVQGISEQFGDGLKGDTAVTTVTLENFNEIVFNDEYDVVLLLHAKNCEPCSHFNVYYKRMAQRFQEMKFPSLMITQMDVTEETPPAQLNMINGPLPLLILLPADNKVAPWLFYSGVGKVQQMMKWIHANVAIKFELPNLPHLTESDRIAYKEQVRQREEALAKKREEDAQAMKEYEASKAADQEAYAKLQEAKKQQAAAEQPSSTVPNKESLAVPQQQGIQIIPSKGGSELLDEDDFDDDIHDEF